jgi:hypothetical protein
MQLYVEGPLAKRPLQRVCAGRASLTWKTIAGVLCVDADSLRYKSPWGDLPIGKRRFPPINVNWANITVRQDPWRRTWRT